MMAANDIKAGDGGGRDGFLDGYPDLLKVEHVAEITGLSKNTVRELLRCGDIPGRHLGGGRRWYTPKPALIAYMLDSR